MTSHNQPLDGDISESLATYRLARNGKTEKKIPLITSTQSRQLSRDWLAKYAAVRHGNQVTKLGIRLANLSKEDATLIFPNFCKVREIYLALSLFAHQFLPLPDMASHRLSDLRGAFACTAMGMINEGGQAAIQIHYTRCNNGDLCSVLCALEICPIDIVQLVQKFQPQLYGLLHSDVVAVHKEESYQTQRQQKS